MYVLGGTALMPNAEEERLLSPSFAADEVAAVQVAREADATALAA